MKDHRKEKPPTRPGVSGSNGNGVSKPDQLEDTSFHSSNTSTESSNNQSTKDYQTVYDYIDSDGVLLYQNIRSDDGKRKTFHYRRPDGRGGWVKTLGKPRMVAHLPYRLPDLLGAPSDQILILHEGEKATDAAARSLPGFVHMATGGTLSNVKHYARLFEGREVVIIQDNDKTGRKHSKLAASYLLTNGAASVRILCLPDLPEKGDCFDWIESGGTSEALRNLIEAAPPYSDKGVSPKHQIQPSSFEQKSNLILDGRLVDRARAVAVLPILELDTTLKKIAHREYAGPCPFCGGRDRLHINVEKNGWFCRQCGNEPGPGQPWQDAIAYVMQRDHLTFVEAVRELSGDPAHFESSSQAMHASEPRSKDLWRFLNLAQVRNLPPIDYLVDGKIPNGGLTVLFGPPNVGKSFYALDIGLRLSEDRPVFYLAGEGRNGYADRVLAWEKHHGTSGGQFFLSENGLPSLLYDQHVDALLEALKGFSSPVIIVDTLAYALAGGDENSAKDMMLLLAQLNRIRLEENATILLIHHTTKAGSSERGSSALRGGVDSMIEISGSDGYLCVSCTKSKDASPFDDEHYRLMPVTTRGERTSMVVVPANQIVQTRQDKLKINQSKVLRTLLLETFREAGCRAALLERAAEITNVHRTLSELMELGYVRQHSEGEPYYITSEGITRIAPDHPSVNRQKEADNDSNADGT